MRGCRVGSMTRRPAMRISEGVDSCSESTHLAHVMLARSAWWLSCSAVAIFAFKLGNKMEEYMEDLEIRRAPITSAHQ